MIEKQRDSEEKREGKKTFPARGASFSISAVCVACGTRAERVAAKYCLVCGKILSEDYQPLDALRSAHHLQGKTFLVENAETREEIKDLFEINKNSVSEMAWASFVYSMVPYLGILFIPFTIIVGTYGFGVAVRYPKAGGKNLSLVSIGLSFFVLGIQIFLWYLLYLIPELTGGI